MFRGRTLQDCGFRFSATENASIHSDKLRGLVKYGPYQSITHNPRIGFVFPTGYRDYANQLFRALKNGIGRFKGMESLFGIGIESSNVFPISDFVLDNPHDDYECAQRYRDAIVNRQAGGKEDVDIFISLHPKTLGWEDDSAYAATKAVLLEAGILSQSVTFDLIESVSQFEWAAANIALAIFVKLGGIPWVVNSSAGSSSVVIGAGRSENWDPITRKTTRYSAFTTCMRGDGLYELTAFGRICSTKEEYLIELKSAVAKSVEAAITRNNTLKGLVVHFPKDFSRDEISAIKTEVFEKSKSTPLSIDFLKVTEEERFFAFDDGRQGIPERGTCIKLDSKDYLLYTEGDSERAAWASRPPTAVHIKHFADSANDRTLDLLGQIFDLSLVNYRGFNAKAFPISIYYSQLVARVVKRLAGTTLPDERLASKMWFL